MAISIKQIQAFNLVVMRIAGFLEYLQQFVKLVRAYAYTEGSAQSKLPAKVLPFFTALASAVAGVDSAYKQSRASDYTKRIADEDTRRDNLYTALKNQVQMYLKFDFDQEMQEAAQLLWNIMKKYNIDVTENYSEESGKLQQMLQELDTNYQAELRLKKLGLESLVSQLKTANEAVRTLMSQRNDERTYQQKAALATARKQADEDYHDFVAMLNAAALMDENEYTYEELFNQINELINYNRLYVVPKKGSKSEDEDGGDSEDGSSSDDGGQQDGGSSEGGEVTPVQPENPGGTSTGGGSGTGGGSNDGGYNFG